MSTDTVIVATTDAVTAKQSFQTQGYQTAIVAANNLAGAEEADLFMDVGGTWVALADSAGAAVKLTASIPMLALEGGPQYAATKDATAGACGIYVVRQVQLA